MILTIEDMHQIAEERGGKCLSKEYVNNLTKLQWKCVKGHRWWAAPNNIKQGNTWCPKCTYPRRKKLTIEEMYQIAKERGGKCISTEYVGALTKLEWQCEEGHRWMATPSDIKKGRWCPICAKKRVADANSKRRINRNISPDVKIYATGDRIYWDYEKNAKKQRMHASKMRKEQKENREKCKANNLLVNSDDLLVNSKYERDSKRIPTRELFRETINRLLMRKDMNALMTLKLQCFLGLRRIEVANARVCNIDRFNRRGLFIDATKATKLKHETKPTVKPREQPIPRSFYLELTEFVRDSDRTYILKRKKKGYSDDKPFTPRHISYFYAKNQIPWSTHSSRRYYAQCILDHMRKIKFIQKPLLRSLLGHVPIDDVTDLYINPISFEYKLSFIDNIEFYQDIEYGGDLQKNEGIRGGASDDPFHIIAIRYASGEINLEEYNSMSRAITYRFRDSELIIKKYGR